MPKNIMEFVKEVSEGNYITIQTHDILKDEEMFTFNEKTYLVDLDGAHIQDGKKNNHYYFDIDTGEAVYLKTLPNPTKFYNPTKLDMFLKKKILQQLWGKIREQGTGSQYLIFILLGIGVGIGVGLVIGIFAFPHQSIIQVVNGTSTQTPTI